MGGGVACRVTATSGASRFANSNCDFCVCQSLNAISVHKQNILHASPSFRPALDLHLIDLPCSKTNQSASTLPTAIYHSQAHTALKMFPADALMASYIEEQGATYKAKRKEAMEKAGAGLKTNIPSATSSTTTPETAHPASNKPSGMLGTLWQGFFKPPSPTTSASSSVTSTPALEKTEQEAYAERMREIDLVCQARVAYTSRLTECSAQCEFTELSLGSVCNPFTITTT